MKPKGPTKPSFLFGKAKDRSDKGEGTAAEEKKESPKKEKAEKKAGKGDKAA